MNAPLAANSTSNVEIIANCHHNDGDDGDAVSSIGSVQDRLINGGHGSINGHRKPVVIVFRPRLLARLHLSFIVPRSATFLKKFAGLFKVHEALSLTGQA